MSRKSWLLPQSSSADVRLFNRRTSAGVYDFRTLLKDSSVKRLAFVICTKRGGVGYEGEKPDREKGREPLHSLPISPTPAPLFPSSQSLLLSTPATQAINRPSSSLVYMCWYVAGTCWGKLIKKQVDTSRADLMGRVAESVVFSPLHSYRQMRFPYLRSELCIWDILSSRQN